MAAENYFQTLAGSVPAFNWPIVLAVSNLRLDPTEMPSLAIAFDVLPGKYERTFGSATPSEAKLLEDNQRLYHVFELLVHHFEGTRHVVERKAMRREFGRIDEAVLENAQ